jgi:hypothetical protein
LAAGRGIWTASSPPLAGKIGTGPRHIGSKTAENRQKITKNAPTPTPWLARAWAMFLSNIHMKNGIECFT